MEWMMNKCGFMGKGFLEKQLEDMRRWASGLTTEWPGCYIMRYVLRKYRVFLKKVLHKCEEKVQEKMEMT